MNSWTQHMTVMSCAALSPWAISVCLKIQTLQFDNPLLYCILSEWTARLYQASFDPQGLERQMHQGRVASCTVVAKLVGRCIDGRWSVGRSCDLLQSLSIDSTCSPWWLLWNPFIFVWNVVQVPTSGVWITIPETHVPRFVVNHRIIGRFNCRNLQDQHFALANCTESWYLAFLYVFLCFWRVQFMIRRVCVYKSRSWGCGCMQYMVCFEAKADIGRSCWLVRFSWSSCSRWRKSTPLSVDTDAGGLLLSIQVFFWILQVLLAFHIVFGWLYVSIMDISL